MVRRLIAVLIVALLAASCSSSDRLASVNDVDITKGDLFALRPSYEGDASVDSETVRSDLTLLIILEAVKDAAADQYGYEVAEAAIDERIANPPERYAGLFEMEEDADVAEHAVRASAVQSLLRDALVAELAKEDAGSWELMLAEHPEDVTRTCLRHISVATEEEAADVMTRLESGEDFVAVAEEVSTDTTNRGELLATAEGDCLVFYTMVGTEFAHLAATAPVGEPVGPIQAYDEFNILLVEEKLAPSLAELEADPLEWLDPTLTSALYTPWFNDVVRAADIYVSPTVGRWSEDGIGIAPPGE